LSLVSAAAHSDALWDLSAFREDFVSADNEGSIILWSVKDDGSEGSESIVEKCIAISGMGLVVIFRYSSCKRQLQLTLMLVSTAFMQFSQTCCNVCGLLIFNIIVIIVVIMTIMIIYSFDFKSQKKTAVV